MATMATNIYKTSHLVNNLDRMKSFGHAASVFWLTGHSGSGKSTLAMLAEKELQNLGYACFVMDGDNIRHGINKDLGFSNEDRLENIRRVAEISKLFSNAGLISICAFISPLKSDRALARSIIESEGVHFHEVHIDSSVEVCESRDIKGLYKLAREGKIKHFTGVSAPYEAPEKFELRINSANSPLEICKDQLIDYIKSQCPIVL